MHRKLERGRRNYLRKLPQIDLGNLCKFARNKGGGQSHMKKSQPDEKGNIREVNRGRNLKGIGRPRPVALARFSLTMTLKLKDMAQ